MVWSSCMTAVLDQRPSSLCCWSELLENRSSRSGAKRTLAARASCEPALVFWSWVVPTHVLNSFAQALIRCAAVRYTRLVGSYPPFWSTVQALQARPRYAPILLRIRVLDSCAQALARSATVCCAWLVELHSFLALATVQALQARSRYAHILPLGVASRATSRRSSGPGVHWLASQAARV